MAQRQLAAAIDQSPQVTAQRAFAQQINSPRVAAQRFSSGHRAVSRLQAGGATHPPVVQRYFLHTPAAGEAAETDFQAQEKRPGSQDFLNTPQTAPNVDHPRVMPAGAAQMPPLRVSNDGNLAVENSANASRQAKVFFTTQGLVDESNARLTELNSPYRLQIDVPNAVTINAPLRMPPIHQVLGRVVPNDVGNPAGGGAGLTMDLLADRCNEVAEKISQTGSLANAGAEGRGVHIPTGSEEYRVVRYIDDRKNGLTHANALANLNNPVAGAATAGLTQQYVEATQPAIKTGKEIETWLGAAGVNYWAQYDVDLANYLVSRTAGTNHVGSVGTLAGLNLTAPQLTAVERAFNNEKIPDVVNTILAATAAIPLAANPLTGMVPNTPDNGRITTYVRQRIENGLSHNAACTNFLSIQPAQQPAYSTAVDLAYAAGLANAPAFNAVDLRNGLKAASPDLGLEYRLKSYVESRHQGNLHAAALLTIGGGAGLPAAVVANLDAAYNAVVALYPQTPQVQALNLQQALQDLGVNQFAAPEIGQIFNSSMTGIPNAEGRVEDYGTGKARNASSEGWSAHYGAVIAKSGGDSITLENYARVAENAGDIGARTKQYYFQMYGSDAGQSWHDAWTRASRPIMNAVSMVYGADKQTVWSQQLAAIPAPLTGVNLPGTHAATLALHQANIAAAGTVALAKAAYFVGLDTLLAETLTAHRNVFNPAGLGWHLAALSPINVADDGAALSNELNAWLTGLQATRAAMWRTNLIGKEKMAKRIRRVQRWIAKVDALNTFRNQRRA